MIFVSNLCKCCLKVCKSLLPEAFNFRILSIFSAITFLFLAAAKINALALSSAFLAIDCDLSSVSRATFASASTRLVFSESANNCF